MLSYLNLHFLTNHVQDYFYSAQLLLHYPCLSSAVIYAVEKRVDTVGTQVQFTLALIVVHSGRYNGFSLLMEASGGLHRCLPMLIT